MLRPQVLYPSFHTVCKNFAPPESLSKTEVFEKLAGRKSQGRKGLKPLAKLILDFSLAKG
jgi:hypothetical protein